MSEHCKFFDVCPISRGVHKIHECNEVGAGSVRCISLLLEAYYSLDYEAGKISHADIKELLNSIYGSNTFEKDLKIEKITYDGHNIDEIFEFCRPAWPEIKATNVEETRVIIWPDSCCRIYLHHGQSLEKLGKYIRLLEAHKKDDTIIYSGTNIKEVLAFCKQIWPLATAPLVEKYKAIIRTNLEPKEGVVNTWQLYLKIGDILEIDGEDVKVVGNVDKNV